jgi:hypothetical protein
MNNSDFPNVSEDLFDFLTHPHHWAGTEVILRMKDTNVLSVLHYNVLLAKYYWYIMPSGSRVLPELGKSRLGHTELCEQLIKEGWVLENA